MSNMSKAVKRSGEIWLSMARDVLVEEGRKMKSIGPQGEMQSVELAKPVVNEKGEIETENDLSEAEFDVNVDVGPSSSSKRAATVRALTGMASLTDDAETKQVLGAMAMMNMEGEGITEVRDYFRKKLLRMGVVKPTEEEQQTMADEQANQKPDPNTQYLQAAAEAEQARAVKARADTVLVVAKADEVQASTAKILSEIDNADTSLALKAAELVTNVHKGV
jgi:hypothetical protein